jgi:hypothetical protein
MSYRRSRREEIGLLVAALHDHGLPAWQDLAGPVSLLSRRRGRAAPTTSAATAAPWLAATRSAAARPSARAVAASSIA